MAAKTSDLPLDVGDTGIDSPVAEGKGIIAPYNRFLHDPAVQFEEYHYYAQLTRPEERETARKDTATMGILQVIFPTKSGAGVTPIYYIMYFQLIKETIH
jgi:hypothetical protein